MLTIPEFTSLTQQQIFDTAARHILSTGTPSIIHHDAEGVESTCIYSGTGCNAAPFLLPEQREYADRQNKNWLGLKGRRLVPAHEYLFMIALQFAHDSAARTTNFMSNYTLNMQKLARDHSLDASALNGVSPC